MWQQAFYFNEAVAAIRALYKNRDTEVTLHPLSSAELTSVPLQVLVLSHSMGGMVARASFLMSNHVLGRSAAAASCWRIVAEPILLIVLGLALQHCVHPDGEHPAPLAPFLWRCLAGWRLRDSQRLLGR